MDTSVIDMVKDGKYYDFSKAVQQELNNRLASHPELKRREDEFNQIQKMKELFSEVTKLTTKDTQEET